MTVTRELLHPLMGFAWSPDRVSAELVASAYGYQFAVRPMLFRFSTYSARRPRIEPPAKPALPHFEPAVFLCSKRLDTQPVWPDPSAYHKTPAEGIPFIELTEWDHQRLYALKGDIVARGIGKVTGWQMPVYQKRRFQDGVVDANNIDALFPSDQQTYREMFQTIYA